MTELEAAQAEIKRLKNWFTKQDLALQMYAEQRDEKKLKPLVEALEKIKEVVMRALEGLK